MPEVKKNDAYFARYAKLCEHDEKLAPELFEQNGVTRGLRAVDGTGVVVGLTNISRIDAFEMQNGRRTPCEGKLWFRGYEVRDLVRGFGESHGGFEEAAYLLLFGELPAREELREFREVLADARSLPRNFTKDVIMKAPSGDIMNSITRSVLTLASYDRRIRDQSLENVLRQCIRLIALFPMLAVYAYRAYDYGRNHSLYIHRPKAELSTAENVLRMLRPDKQYSPLEAQVLDTALVLHMEHGGGNNSTFTTRVITSAGSDTYATMAAALSSLKGPKHGGANIKVAEMMSAMRAELTDRAGDGAIRDYLARVLEGQAFDGKGLIYGMGHAVYSLSDPRATVLRGFVERLAAEKGRERELRFYEAVERLAPEVIADKRKIYKGVSANVDFYSGFVYSMLGIPLELYTPIFAIARIAGWSAHRIEELVNVDKIIRPAYKSVITPRDYVPIERR